jgi:hypothetical protein
MDKRREKIWEYHVENLGTFVSHTPQYTATILNLNASRNGGQQKAFFRARPLLALIVPIFSVEFFSLSAGNL